MIIRIISATVPLALAACAPLAPPSRLPPGLGPVFDALVPPILARDRVPGAVLAVGDADGIAVERAWGDAQRVPGRVPMTTDALFDLASISKVVGTATAVMALVEEGKLKLEDPVARYISGFASADKRTITVADLLTHASGLPAYLPVPEVEARHGPGPNPEAVIADIAASLLLHPVRGGYRYS